MKIEIKSVYAKLFLAFLAVTLLSLVVYIGIQQNLRCGANDPQTQLAEEYATQISNGDKSSGDLIATKVNLANSSATFVIVYNAGGAVLASSAVLDGKTPVLPKGVLDSAKSKGKNTITWQPKKGVREAIVVKPLSSKSGGYVLVGRSLQETENKIDKVGLWTLLGWLIALAISTVVIIFTSKRDISQIREQGI